MTVKKGQVWKDKDNRELEVLEITNTHAVCQNIEKGNHTSILLTSLTAGKNYFLTAEKKDADYEPDFDIQCPGGMTALFKYRLGSFLFWRGRLPYGMETAAGTEHRYILITDLKGNEIRTQANV